jgi:hypothetical protein
MARQYDHGDEDRHHHCEEPQRLILRHVVVEVLHALGRGADQLAAALRPGERRTERHDMSSKIGPKPAFQVACRPLREHVPGTGQRGADRQKQKHDSLPRQNVAQAIAIDEHASDDFCQQVDLSSQD